MTNSLEIPELDDTTNLSLEEQKAELAELYLSLMDTKKEGLLGQISSLGVSLNPLKDKAKKYLLSQNKEKKGFLKKITDKGKELFIKKVSKEVNIDLEYDRTQLDALKILLTSVQTTDQLTSLKQQLEEGKTPTTINAPTIAPNSPDVTVTSPETPTTASVDRHIQFTPTSSDVVTTLGSVVLSAELLKVREKIEIHEDFAKIKKVKNADGKVILECTAKTPYINVKALDDVLGLADAFFKKTGKALSLNSVYRTIDHQKDLKKKNTVPTATPGKSGHNLGLSMDINNGDRYSKAIGGIQGFRDLAKMYNFNPIKSEDWHFDHETLPKADDRLAIAQTLDTQFAQQDLAA